MHTPGPWKLSRTVDGFLAVAGPRGRNVCSVGADELFPDIIHNAHLIAAAPDLLEALKELVELPKRLDITGIAYITAIANAEEKAREAIATAEGRI